MRQEIQARRRILMTHLLTSSSLVDIAKSMNVQYKTIENDVRWIQQTESSRVLDKKQTSAYIFRTNLAIQRIESLLDSCYADLTNASDLNDKVVLRNQIAQLEGMVVNFKSSSLLSKISLFESKIKSLKKK